MRIERTLDPILETEAGKGQKPDDDIDTGAKVLIGTAADHNHTIAFGKSAIQHLVRIQFKS